MKLMVFSDVSTSSPFIKTLVKEALTGEYSALLHLGNIAMNMSGEHGTVSGIRCIVLYISTLLLPHNVSFSAFFSRSLDGDTLHYTYTGQYRIKGVTY